jgi:hypothetical protein
MVERLFDGCRQAEQEVTAARALGGSEKLDGVQIRDRPRDVGNLKR